MQTDLSADLLASTDADARYGAALNLVRTIDCHLERGTCHYRDGQGRLLRTLEQAVRAMLRDDLVVRGPAVAEVPQETSPKPIEQQVLVLIDNELDEQFRPVDH